MTTEDNSKGVISPEVSDVPTYPPSEDEQASRKNSAGQRYGSNVPQVFVFVFIHVVTSSDIRLLQIYKCNTIQL